MIVIGHREKPEMADSGGSLNQVTQGFSIVRASESAATWRGRLAMA
jgi:hypothetical protein